MQCRRTGTGGRGAAVKVTGPDHSRPASLRERRSWGDEPHGGVKGRAPWLGQKFPLLRDTKAWGFKSKEETARLLCLRIRRPGASGQALRCTSGRCGEGRRLCAAPARDLTAPEPAAQCRGGRRRPVTAASRFLHLCPPRTELTRAPARRQGRGLPTAQLIPLRGPRETVIVHRFHNQEWGSQPGPKAGNSARGISAVKSLTAKV